HHKQAELRRFHQILRPVKGERRGPRLARCEPMVAICFESNSRFDEFSGSGVLTSFTRDGIPISKRSDMLSQDFVRKTRFRKISATSATLSHPITQSRRSSTGTPGPCC